ncbi:hypothetical protein PGA94_09155 [Pediococcus pentosaceus]|uniref:hypothetical protein n=1 Tax=Pediococcus pentosaceus TaxID=1255 RepID=UPI0023300825|nr:hypothetical protein [Pediococcus pentosaceus]MDB1562940.1 hypothetical protein [Pediococcus pentosaceus]
MTKDELNGILKEDGMYLSPVGNGTFNDFFYVLNESCAVVEFNGVDFIFSRDDGQGYGKKIVAALIEYANTPIEERKPKPQLYNIIIAKDIQHGSPYLTAWRKVNKLGQYFVTDATEQHDLLHDNDFKFTVEEIEDLKSKVSEKQKQIIDIGVEKVEDTMSAKIDTKVVPF